MSELSTRNVEKAVYRCVRTERQVDDDVVRAEVRGDVARVGDEQCCGGALCCECDVSITAHLMIVCCPTATPRVPAITHSESRVRKHHNA